MEHFNLIKSFTTLVNNITSLPSREGLGLGLGKVRMGLRMLILCLALATFGVNEAWGTKTDYYSKATVSANPSGGGKVYVAYNSSTKPASPNSEAKKEKDSQEIAPNHTYYFWADVNPGYSWSGWTFTNGNPNSSSTQSNATSKITANEKVEKATITATATFTAHTYKVNFYGNGATSGSMSQQTLTYDQTPLTANAFTRSYTVNFDADGGSTAGSMTADYTFNDWNTKADGTGIIYTNQQKNLTTENGVTINLYAQWESAPITLPTSTRSGYVLDGWFSEDKKIGNPGDSYIPSTNISLKAKWTGKYNPDFSYSGSTSYNVGDGPIDLQQLWTSTGDGAITYTKTSFTPESGQQSGSTEPAITDNRYLSLNKAGILKIHLEQAETSSYYAGSEDVTITISRIANTLTVDATHTMKIGETWTSVCSGINSDAGLSVNNTHEEIATYNPATNTITAHQAGTTTITFTQEATYKYTATSKSITVTVNKKDPAFTWNNFPSSMQWAQIIDATCSSTNTSSDCPITITSNNPEIAYYADGKIYAYNKSGTATFTVYQAGNDYEWSEKSQNFSITVTKPNNHVEVTMNNQTIRDAVYNDKGNNGNISCGTDGKISLDQNGGIIVSTANPLYYTIKFSGVPDKLNFTYSQSMLTSTAIGKTKKSFIVYESSDGSSWTEIWTSDGALGNTNDHNTTDCILPSTTRYLKFFFDGTYAGYYKNIKITERPASVEASDMTISGTHRMGDAATTQNLNINWYNVPQLTVTSSNPKFTFNGNETYIIPSSCDQSAEQVQVPITYAHDAVTTGDYDEAIITFTSQNGVYTKTVTVKGRTDKKVQTLSWNFLEEQPVFRPGQEEAVAQSNQGLTPVYTITSSDPMGDDKSQPVFELTEDGTKIKGVFPGTATIMATQPGNETIEEAEPISKTFKVSYKKAIQIKWNQNLMKLKSDGEPITLTAKAYEQDSEASELVENTSKTAAITYSSDNTSIVSISGSTLTIMGIGTTTIRAHIDGDDDFESADIAMSVKIRDASIVGCDDPLVLDAPNEVDFFQMDIDEIVKNEIAIERSNGEHPDKLSFQHKGEKWASIFYEGSIKAQQKVNGSWTDIAGSSVTPTVGTYNLKENLQLNPDATHIRFVRPFGGQGYHYIKNVEVTLKHSLEVAETEHDFGTKKINEENVCCDFTINYFNIKANSLTVSVSGDVTVDKTETKDEECGKIGSDVVRVSLNTTTEGAKSGTVTFLDAVTNQSLTVTFTGNVEKLTPEIVTLPTATATERLENPTLADLTLQGGEASVEGTFTWKSSDTPIQEGDHTYWVVFTPSKTDWYSSTEVEIHVVLSSKTQYIDWNTQPMYIYCGQILELDAVSKANSDNLETGLTINYRVDNTALATVEGNILTTLKPGTLTITAQQQGDLAYVAAEELQKVIYIQPNVFTGTGDWNDGSNWSAGVSPTDDQPTVSIAGSLIIDKEVTAGVLTIESTGTVTIADGGVLTIEGTSAARETYGDLTVGNGGQLVLNASAQLDVRNVYISSSVATHSSGQVSGAEHLVNHGDVYFDWTPGANATNTQWHAFTVPFPVNVNTGIFDLDGNKLRAEYHYAVMGYHSDIRANGQYGWKKCYNWNGGILQPGDFYIMATDGDHATYRFKMLAGSSIATPNSKDIIAYSGTGDVSDQGWNAVGNPTLMYGKVDYVVQVLDPTSYTYRTYQANECNFTVGTPFAIQAATDGSMTMLTADAEETYAPARLMDINTIVANCKLFFSNATFSDQLLVSASEEASNTYEIGKDLVKMTMTATPAVPQIFAHDYSVKLCAINTPMTNNQAVVNLLLYAPAVGEYTISAQPMEGVTAYLTYNGTVIWNLSLSAYNLDLNKGDNAGYGVLLTYEAPQVVTDCDEVKANNQNAQKLIINNNLYILRDGLLYDATGKVIK